MESGSGKSWKKREQEFCVQGASTRWLRKIPENLIWVGPGAGFFVSAGRQATLNLRGACEYGQAGR